MPRRLRSQLALVIAVAMAPAGLVAILQALSGANDEIEQRETVFASEMRAAALRERDALQQVRTALATAADEAEEALLATGDCDGVLDRFARERPDLERAALLDARGRVVCGETGWSVTQDLPQWREFVADPEASFILKPEAGEDGSWRVIALHPTVFMRPEAFALAAEIELSQLRAMPTDESGRRVYGVLDDSGVLIAESTPRASGWLPSDPGIMLGNVDMAIADTSRSGVDRLYISQPLVDGQLWAIASVPKAGFLDVVGSTAGLTVLGPILLWMIAVAVAYVSIDKLVTRHVAYLGRAAARIGQGDLGSEIRRLDNAPREIRALGDAIRDMAGNLQDRDSGMRDALENQKNLILEIHHRVKNNLQMVTSLINIQLRRAKSGEERDALRFLEDRVQSLAVVHQHLYGSEELD
ncbi:MAG TPA: histidine kinase dimerization/phosphoacceptor domain -containing protein, partial [Paracoccaceae bacterium]|nr:histidine kinase dimerization/phosphoacceptor domain -containing protein [Paracoccaceae bacterium]